MYSIEGIRKTKEETQERINEYNFDIKKLQKEYNELSKIEIILEQAGVEAATMPEFYILQLLQNDTITDSEKIKMVNVIESIEKKEKVTLSKYQTKGKSIRNNIWYSDPVGFTQNEERETIIGRETAEVNYR